MADADAFRAARDVLLEHRNDLAAAAAAFAWPRLDRFNWALDYFDPMATGNEQIALRILGPEFGRERQFRVACGALQSSRQLPARGRGAPR